MKATPGGRFGAQTFQLEDVHPTSLALGNADNEEGCGDKGNRVVIIIIIIIISITTIAIKDNYASIDLEQFQATVKEFFFCALPLPRPKPSQKSWPSYFSPKR